MLGMKRPHQKEIKTVNLRLLRCVIMNFVKNRYQLVGQIILRKQRAFRKNLTETRLSLLVLSGFQAKNESISYYACLKYQECSDLKFGSD